MNAASNAQAAAFATALRRASPKLGGRKLALEAAVGACHGAGCEQRHRPTA